MAKAMQRALRAVCAPARLTREHVMTHRQPLHGAQCGPQHHPIGPRALLMRHQRGVASPAHQDQHDVLFADRAAAVGARARKTAHRATPRCCCWCCCTQVLGELLLPVRRTSPGAGQAAPGTGQGRAQPVSAGPGLPRGRRVRAAGEPRYRRPALFTGPPGPPQQSPQDQWWRACAGAQRRGRLACACASDCGCVPPGPRCVCVCAPTAGGRAVGVAHPAAAVAQPVGVGGGHGARHGAGLARGQHAKVDGGRHGASRRAGGRAGGGNAVVARRGRGNRVLRRGTPRAARCAGQGGSAPPTARVPAGC